MRRIVLSVMFFVSMSCGIVLLINCASPGIYDVPADVIQFPGMSKQEIYSKTVQWFSHTFVSGKTVIDYKDPKTGTVIGKGLFPACGMTLDQIAGTITIEIKEGRARFSAQATAVQGGNGQIVPFYRAMGYPKCFDGRMKDLKDEYTNYIMKKQKDW